MKMHLLPRAVRSASRGPAWPPPLLMGLLLTALTLAGGRSTHASPAADAPRGGDVAAPQTLFLPCTMKRPPDMSGPEVNVALIINGQQVTAPNNAFSAPHLHGTPSGYYRLKMTASDAGVGKLGWDTNGDGVMDISNEVILLAPDNFGTWSYQAVAMDFYGNYSRVPVTLVLTNEPPTSPVLIEGDGTAELGEETELEYSSSDPNGDDVAYAPVGQLPLGASFVHTADDLGRPSVTLRFIPTFEQLYSAQNPYEATIQAIEREHGHAPELCTNHTGQIHVVDTTPPHPVLMNGVGSDTAEQVIVSVNPTWDNWGYGKIHDVQLAIAEHPIDQQDWDNPAANQVITYSIKQLFGIPTGTYLSGVPYAPRINVGKGGTFYADARQIDAAGNIGPSLDNDPSVSVRSLPEDYVHYWTDNLGVFVIPYSHSAAVVLAKSADLAQNLAAVTPGWTAEQLNAYLLSTIDGVNNPNGDNFELANETQSNQAIQLNRVNNNNTLTLVLWIPDASALGGHLWYDIYRFQSRPDLVPSLLSSIQAGLVEYCGSNPGEFGHFAPGHRPYDVVPPWLLN